MSKLRCFGHDALQETAPSFNTHHALHKNNNKYPIFRSSKHVLLTTPSECLEVLSDEQPTRQVYGIVKLIMRVVEHRTTFFHHTCN